LVPAWGETGVVAGRRTRWADSGKVQKNCNTINPRKMLFISKPIISPA